MPLINESYDSLPYIDAPLTDPAMAAAKAVIDSEIQSSGVDTTQFHPTLAAAVAYAPQFSEALEAEHARLENDPQSKLKAIDMTRYEPLEAPPVTNPTSDEDEPELLQQWQETLRKAYTSSEFLNSRLAELNLLEKFGKNAWLVGNSQMEDILKAIEMELANTRAEMEGVEAARKTQQEAVKGEIELLEATWKRGVGRVLETEVAAEGLKQQILEKRRAGAV